MPASSKEYTCLQPGEATDARSFSAKPFRPTRRILRAIEGVADLWCKKMLSCRGRFLLTGSSTLCFGSALERGDDTAARQKSRSNGGFCSMAPPKAHALARNVWCLNGSTPNKLMIQNGIFVPDGKVGSNMTTQNGTAGGLKDIRPRRTSPTSPPALGYCRGTHPAGWASGPSTAADWRCPGFSQALRVLLRASPPVPSGSAPAPTAPGSGHPSRRDSGG